MEKRNNVLIGIILIGIIAFILFVGIKCPYKEKESSTAILNAQKEILRIDTIIKRYDSIIYKTKIKTSEKIITIYLWPDSILIDSIRAKLNQFDSIGTPKNISYNGAI
jgi:hypothetical protein